MSFEADDFVGCFNDAYREYENCDYLLPVENWTKINEPSPYCNLDSVCYRFSINEKDFTKPNLCLYKPYDDNGVYEIRLVFHDHDYRSETYEDFEKMCKAAIKTFFPEIEDVGDLYDKLYKQANENFWGEGDNGKIIDCIYCCDDMAIYGFYGAGTANICIIPVTEGILSRLGGEGTTIHIVK